MVTSSLSLTGSKQALSYISCEISYLGAFLVDDLPHHFRNEKKMTYIKVPRDIKFHSHVPGQNVALLFLLGAFLAQ